MNAERRVSEMFITRSHFAQHYLRIANFYVQNGAFKKATFFYKKAIGKDPSTTTAYYNLACIESLQNRPKKAFKLLENALKNGFANYDWLQKDPDFDRLRARREWPVLIKKYFPEKVRA